MKKLILSTIIMTMFISCSDKQKREQALKALDNGQQQFVDINKQVEDLEVEGEGFNAELAEKWQLK